MPTTSERAYKLWEARGRPVGDAWVDWFAAEAAERAESERQAEALRRLDEAIAIACVESARLLDQIHVEEGDYRHFSRPYDLAGAKRYFLSRCLMNVQVASGAMMRLRGHLGRRADTRLSDGAQSIIARSILAEQALWRRRLTEVLATAILFATTDTHEHYLSYLLLSEAVESAREADNIQGDFNVDCKTLRRRSADLQNEIAALQTTTPRWYAQPDKGGVLKLASAAKIVRRALAAAAPHERTALGYSYRLGFSAPSEKIHFSTHVARVQDAEEETELGTVAFLLTSNAITTRVAALAGLPSTLPLDRGQRLADARLPDVGDFVVVVLDRASAYIAEVLEREEVGGVIGRVRVRFFDEAPYADILEDDFPSDVVQLFQRRADLVAEVSGRLPEGVPRATVDEAVRHAMKMVWTMAMRDQWLDGLRHARRSLRRPDTGGSG